MMFMTTPPRVEGQRWLGETARHKQLFEEKPQTKDRIENEYFEARNRSLQLLGTVLFAP